MLALVNAEAEDVNLKNCALGGSIILSTGGSTFVSAEDPFVGVGNMLFFGVGVVVWRNVNIQWDMPSIEWC